MALYILPRNDIVSKANKRSPSQHNFLARFLHVTKESGLGRGDRRKSDEVRSFARCQNDNYRTLIVLLIMMSRISVPAIPTCTRACPEPSHPPLNLPQGSVSSLPDPRGHRASSSRDLSGRCREFVHGRKMLFDDSQKHIRS